MAVLLAVAALASASQASAATVSQIATGEDHTCLLMSTGVVKCVGGNSSGQLGDGTGIGRGTLAAVSGISDATQITAGYWFTCAIVTDGNVKCWGFNTYGALGDGTTVDRFAPVSVTGVSGAVAISAGNYHVCAVLGSGSVKCWGWNASSQVLAGAGLNIATPVTIPVISGATSIASGGFHNCALVDGGAAKCWGGNGAGQLGDGSTTDAATPVAVSGLSGATALAAGNAHTCALLSTGGVSCWGTNFRGQLGNGTNTDSVTPTAVYGLSSVASITSGDKHMCAVISTGMASCWGENTYGQLGIGSTAHQNVPTSVDRVYTATAAASRGFHTCMIISGAPKCFGYNTQKQLGLGGFINTDQWKPEAMVDVFFTPAAPTITSAPAEFTKSNTASIAWTGPSEATFTCSLDYAPPTPCTSPLNLSSLSESSHTLDIRSVVAGADGPSDPATARWSVDVTAPGLPYLTGTPASPTSSTSATFNFGGETGATFLCSLDSASFSPCTSPRSLTVSANAVHSFRVKQVDRAGNESSPRSASWTVDTIPPTAPVFSSKPAAFINTTSATVAFIAPPAGTLIRCALGSAPATTCTSPKTVTSLISGAYSFTVLFTDEAGNTSSSVANWTVDRTAPVMLSKTKTKTSTQTSYKFTMGPDVSGVAKVERSTAVKKPSSTATSVAGSTVSFASPTVFKTSLTIRWIRFKDNAGNWSGWYAG